MSDLGQRFSLRKFHETDSSKRRPVINSGSFSILDFPVKRTVSFSSCADEPGVFRATYDFPGRGRKRFEKFWKDSGLETLTIHDMFSDESGSKVPFFEGLKSCDFGYHFDSQVLSLFFGLFCKTLDGSYVNSSVLSPDVKPDGNIFVSKGSIQGLDLWVDDSRIDGSVFGQFFPGRSSFWTNLRVGDSGGVFSNYIGLSLNAKNGEKRESLNLFYLSEKEGVELVSDSLPVLKDYLSFVSSDLQPFVREDLGKVVEKFRYLEEMPSVCVDGNVGALFTLN